MTDIEVISLKRGIVAYNVKQRSPEWFKLREFKWTGSTAIDLLQGKLEPPAGSDYDNDHMRRGRVLESMAIEGYEIAEHGEVGVVKQYGFIVNSKYPNAGYSPDGIDGQVVLEVKCFSARAHNDLVRGIIPPKIAAQVQFGMVILATKTAKIIAYNPDFSPSMAVIPVRQDPKIAKNIREKLNAHYERNKERY